MIGAASVQRPTTNEEKNYHRGHREAKPYSAAPHDSGWLLAGRFFACFFAEFQD